MEFLKNFFKEDDAIIGLCELKKIDDDTLRTFIPKLKPSNQVYDFNYNKNFFLL